MARVDVSHQAMFSVDLEHSCWRNVEDTRMWVPEEVQSYGNMETDMWACLLFELFGGSCCKENFVMETNCDSITLDMDMSPYTIVQLQLIIGHVTDHLNAGKPVFSQHKPYLHNRGSERYVDNEWKWGTFLPSLDAGEDMPIPEGYEIFHGHPVPMHFKWWNEVYKVWCVGDTPAEALTNHRICIRKKQEN